MFIMGIGTAAPPTRYSQAECWQALQAAPQFAQLNSRARAILRKVLANDSVLSRHLAYERLADAFELTPDALHRRFLAHAPALAADAAAQALSEAAVAPGEIEALLISTCTGYLCPGLTSYVGERLGIPSMALGLDLVGQGCGAALPNLRTAEALVSSRRAKRVLSICVEVCSAAFFLDNDPGVLISACLFGDGAGAAVLGDIPGPGPRMKWRAAGPNLRPAERELLRFGHENGMLRNILSPQVPGFAAQQASNLLNDVLAREAMQPSEVRGWVLHPGGRDVLLALREKMGLAREDIRWSEAVLREFGNVSSASLFFVLREAMADSAQSGAWWLSSFGAGFSCHGAVLEVDL